MDSLYSLGNHLNIYFLDHYPIQLKIVSKISSYVKYAAPFAMAAYYFNQCRKYTVLMEIPNNILDNWKNKKIQEKDLDDAKYEIILENEKFINKKIEKNEPSLIAKRPNTSASTSVEIVEKVGKDLSATFYNSLIQAFSGDFNNSA